MKIAEKQLTSIFFFIAIMILSIKGLNAETIQTTPAQNIEEAKSQESFTEGPHIFYHKEKVCVKYVHFSTDDIESEEKCYSLKSKVPELTCTVDDKEKTSFKIALHSNYQIPPTTYPQPKKLFAISDIEGNFKAFKATLVGNGIIDKNLDWVYGEGHLVMVGDFFDRGTNVTPVLWLVYKLEQQAKQAGGMVHFIIGNHEEMNMRGDVRYVKERYIQTARALKVSYANLYSEKTELGRWLRSKNVIEKIGSTIFVHGGLGHHMAESRIRLEEMNKYAQKYFGTDKWKLEQKGGGAAAVFSKKGPMWYRGYFRGKLSQETIDHTLNMYGADRVVVGHTIVSKISSLFEGKVLAIDVKHEIALSEKTTNALLFENDEIYAVNVHGKKDRIEIFMTEEIVVQVFKGVKESDAAVVKKFLRAEDRINKYYFSNRITLLQTAIHHEQPEMVALLIENGADVEMLSENKTPLMHAIEVNNQTIVDLLIKNGADINALNRQKKSPLFYCAKNGNVEIAKCLVAHGAQIDLKDGKGRTAAEYALKNDNKQVASYLQTCRN